MSPYAHVTVKSSLSPGTVVIDGKLVKLWTLKQSPSWRNKVFSETSLVTEPHYSGELLVSNKSRNGDGYYFDPVLESSYKGQWSSQNMHGNGEFVCATF